MRYLAVLARATGISRERIESLTGIDPETLSASDYVSTQRNLLRGEEGPDYAGIAPEQRLRHLVSLVSDPAVAIRGGTDDERPPRDLAEATEAIPVDAALAFLAHGEQALSRHPHLRMRETDGIVTLFDTLDGTKVRLARPGADLSRPYHPGPELVDVKITDFCGRGCDFCYQGSTPEGLHAPLPTLRALFADLARAGVFELAIGGGEPTRHPRFMDILETAVAQGLVPNVTTRRPGYLLSPRSRPRLARVLDLVGGVAISVDDAEQARTILDQVEQLRGRDRALADRLSARLSLQIVMGVMPREAFEETLEVVRTHGRNLRSVTLLGFKRTGRGADYAPHPYAEWVLPATLRALGAWTERFSPLPEHARRALTDAQVLSIASGEHPQQQMWMRHDFGIDTALAQDLARTYGARLSDVLDDTSYYLEEGVLSCYVDAVEGRIAPSSYARAEQFEPYDASTWRQRFTAMRYGELALAPLIRSTAGSAARDPERPPAEPVCL